MLLRNALLAPIVLLLALGLLWWGENTLLTQVKALDSSAAQVTILMPEGDVRPPSPQGLSYFVGKTSIQRPPQDPYFGVMSKGMVLTRQVEVYSPPPGESTPQWHPVDADEASSAGLRSEKFYAQDVRISRGLDPNDAPLGVSFGISKSFLETLPSRQTIYLNKMPLTWPSTFTLVGTYLYTGIASAPKVGDLRIRFGYASLGTYSILGTLNAAGFQPFVTPDSATPQALMLPGNLTVVALLATLNEDPTSFVWLMRFSAIVLGFIAFYQWVAAGGWLSHTRLYTLETSSSAAPVAMLLSISVLSGLGALLWTSCRPIEALLMIAASCGVFWISTLFRRKSPT